MEEKIDIVRCVDCKHSDIGTDEHGKEFLKCLNGRSYGGTQLNWFCADGERKKTPENWCHLEVDGWATDIPIPAGWNLKMICFIINQAITIHNEKPTLL